MFDTNASGLLTSNAAPFGFTLTAQILLLFGELVKSATLSPADVQRVLTQAGIEIDSDFELASFLISSNRLVADDAARRAYLDAARSIESDFEMRRVLSSILESGQVASPIREAGPMWPRR